MTDTGSAAGDVGRQSLVGTQIDVIASRTEAIAHEIAAVSAAVDEAGAPRAELTTQQLKAASASLHALAAPTRQLHELRIASQ